MSRRASLLARANRDKPPTRSVRFSDELVFQDNVEENDIPALLNMLRRNSLQVDINTINSAGLSALHQAVLDDNVAAVKLLLNHHANVNLLDEDTWTPLHAACANGSHAIARLLLQNGADPHITNEDGERPIDLADPTDFETISVMLQHMQAAKQSNSSQDVNLDTQEDGDDADTQENCAGADSQEDGEDQSESDEPVAPEDSNAEEDRLHTASADARRPTRGSKLERLSSKYLDSDDDDLEYVSEDDDDDDDEVMLRRKSAELDTRSGSRDKHSVSTDRCSDSSYRYIADRDKLSDSYTSNASDTERDDYHGDRHDPDSQSDKDERFCGLVRSRSDPGYTMARKSSRESDDRTSDVGDSEAFQSDGSKFDRSPGSPRGSNNRTLSGDSINKDVASTHISAPNPESARYDTDSDYGQQELTYRERDVNNGAYCRSEPSDLDGFTESS